jgi:hypothetical protein
MAGSPTIERAIVDPNGDTWLIIKNPKWELPAWITTPATPNDNTNAAEENFGNDQAIKPDEVHILVSSRQLRIVSAYFDNMFKGSYKETQLSSVDGKYHISADGWNPDALKLAMNIAHVQVKAIPDKIALTTLVELVVVTDYCVMEAAVAIYTKRWVDQHFKDEEDYVTLYGVTSTLLMFLAAKFKVVDMFSNTASLAMQESVGPLQDLGLPFPKDIVGTWSVIYNTIHANRLSGKLEDRRNNARKALLDGVSSLLNQLEEEATPPCPEACSESCLAQLLGTFRRQLRAAGYLKMLEDENLASVEPLQKLASEFGSIKSTVLSCARRGTLNSSPIGRSGYVPPALRTRPKSQIDCSIQSLLFPLVQETWEALFIGGNEFLQD